jgi:hypothetical protein
MPEQHDSGWFEQRSVAWEEPGRTVAGEYGELHVGRLAGRRAVAIEEIGVSVDEPEAATAGQCMNDTEQERAVAPEDERTLASV